MSKNLQGEPPTCKIKKICWDLDLRLATPKCAKMTEIQPNLSSKKQSPCTLERSKLHLKNLSKPDKMKKKRKKVFPSLWSMWTTFPNRRFKVGLHSVRQDLSVHWLTSSLSLCLNKDSSLLPRICLLLEPGRRSEERPPRQERKPGMPLVWNIYAAERESQIKTSPQLVLISDKGSNYYSLGLNPLLALNFVCPEIRLHLLWITELCLSGWEKSLKMR